MDFAHGLRAHTYPGETHANLSRLLANLSRLIRKSAGDHPDKRAKIRGLRFPEDRHCSFKHDQARHVLHGPRTVQNVFREIETVLLQSVRPASISPLSEASVRFSLYFCRGKPVQRQGRGTGGNMNSRQRGSWKLILCFL